MIFVTVGAREFPFDRLIRQVDLLVRAGVMRDVMAQIGASGYVPTYCAYKRLMTRSEMDYNLERADFIICHAGAGTLDDCLGRRKKVIAAPRLYAYGEASDDHQLELSCALHDKGRILTVLKMDQLAEAVQHVHTWAPVFRMPSENSSLIDAINAFIIDNFGAERTQEPAGRSQ